LQALLTQKNFKLKQCISFGDHHHYSSKEMTKLLELGKLNGCSLITTEKDYVKIHSTYKDSIICAKVNLELDNEQECIDLIYEKLF
jgi:tetraacyldisaccharide-1-P 4'-kinase